MRSFVKRRAVLSIAFAAVLAGCGGSSQPVPDVVGERLDVAKSEMSDAGYDTEELGGGMFGIVDESNWTVCETRPAGGSLDGGKVKLIVDRSCDTTTAASAEVSEEPATEEAAATTRVKKPARWKAKKKQKPAVQRIRVPDVVGLDHQLAQDTLQATGLYMLMEKDATGLGRLLLYDRNWTVVKQSPKPGTRVGENRTITLFSVKDDEL